METPTDALEARRWSALHRSFVLALGGYAVDLAGGTLVVHERIPVPRFNYVDSLRVSIHRQTAFFEKALDHYFQRALRPSFRTALDAPEHVGKTLRHFGFAPAKEPSLVLRASTAGPVGAPAPGGVEVREAASEETGTVAAFWTHERERDEFGRSLDVAVHHPNPGETLVPLLARLGGEVVGAALVYVREGHAEVHAVSTQPRARGQGVATALVARALEVAASRDASDLYLLTEEPRLSERLRPMGFHEATRFLEFRLGPQSQLAIPPPGPPTPPRWRPPRRPQAGGTGSIRAGTP